MPVLVAENLTAQDFSRLKLAQDAESGVQSSAPPARNTSMQAALREFFAAVYPVAPQFLLVMALTGGIGAMKKLSFDAQSVMGSDIFADETTTESKNQYKFIAFGFAKALANVFCAVWSDKLGKTKILTIGWVAGCIHAAMVLGQVFEVTVWSNIFLGIQQGVCWSLMIFYMIDYAGPANRALAVGLNETMGYTAIAIFGKIGPHIWDTTDGELAATRPFVGILVFCAVGLLVTVTGVLKDNRTQVVSEQQKRFEASGVKKFTEEVVYTFPSGRSKSLSVFRFAFAETSFLNDSLMACCLAGIAINYTTTFAWGLSKTWAKAGGGADAAWASIDADSIVDITLTYDLTKGVLQFVFGFYSDRFGRRQLIVGGLSLISVGLVCWCIVGGSATTTESAKNGFFVCSFIMGLGTAMMYAVVIAAVGESADPSWRSSAIGSYRFWRDAGYAIGGLLMAYSTDQSSYLTAALVTAAFMSVATMVFQFVYVEVVEGKLDVAAINREFYAKK